MNPQVTKWCPMPSPFNKSPSLTKHLSKLSSFAGRGIAWNISNTVVNGGWTYKKNLVGGFKHLDFFIVYGIIILPIDELHHFSRWLKPPTRYYWYSNHYYYIIPLFFWLFHNYYWLLFFKMVTTTNQEPWNSHCFNGHFGRLNLALVELLKEGNHLGWLFQHVSTLLDMLEVIWSNQIYGSSAYTYVRWYPPNVKCLLVYKPPWIL